MLVVSGILTSKQVRKFTYVQNLLYIKKIYFYYLN